MHAGYTRLRISLEYVRVKNKLFHAPFFYSQVIFQVDKVKLNSYVFSIRLHLLEILDA